MRPFLLCQVGIAPIVVETQKESFLLNTSETRYDGVGNRNCSIDANGHPTFYDYDELNRLVKESRKIGRRNVRQATEMILSLKTNMISALPAAHPAAARRPAAVISAR